MYPFSSYLYGFDSSLLLVLLAAVLGFAAQAGVQKRYNQYSRVLSLHGVTAAQAARRLLDSEGATDVTVEVSQRGGLSDHYDPRARALRLSSGVYGSSSIAALGIAAHEAGHAVQHADGYGPLLLRNAIVPIVNVASRASMPLLLIGLLMGFSFLAQVGVILYAFAVAFQLITLPVELNASRRALDVLEREGLLERSEIPGARKVLTAAAATYLAAALLSVAQLLRLARIADRRR